MGRHSSLSPARRRIRRASRGLVVAAAAASLAGVELIGGAGTASASTLSSQFAALRQCESGGNYSTNTGNGFYGAYQFDLGTWRSVGGSGYPNQASPATQDALAYRLYQERGWAPWPACSAHLGLTGGGTGSYHTSYQPRSTEETVASRSTSRSPFMGVVLSTEFVSHYRSDVRALQARLASKGYQLTVDGLYGPQTRATVMAFQRAAGIQVDGLAGPQTFGALF